MSELFIRERPIVFLPSLAAALESVERAIILQQVHWLLNQPNSGKVVDGHKWVWGTYEEWAAEYFPMWKPQNLAKHIRKLEEMGVLISAELNAKDHDHTKHYRIDYQHERLQSIVYWSIGSRSDQSIASNTYSSTQSIYRTKSSSKSSSDISSDISSADAEVTYPLPAEPELPAREEVAGTLGVPLPQKKPKPAAKPKPAPPAAPPKQREPVDAAVHRQMMMDLSLVMLGHTDSKLWTEEQAGRLARTARILVEGGASDQMLFDWHKWWRTFDWRGQKNQRPSYQDFMQSFGEWRQQQQQPKEQYTIVPGDDPDPWDTP